MLNESERLLSVLIVDDCADARDSIEAVLVLHGIQTHAVPGGAEALTAVEADPPDVVLIDLLMPGIDGYELAHQLRQRLHSVGKRPLLIALTGCDSDEHRQRSERVGIDLHLVKPVHPAKLIGVLGRFAQVLEAMLPVQPVCAEA